HGRSKSQLRPPMWSPPRSRDCRSLRDTAACFVSDGQTNRPAECRRGRDSAQVCMLLELADEPGRWPAAFQSDVWTRQPSKVRALTFYRPNPGIALSCRRENPLQEVL